MLILAAALLTLNAQASESPMPRPLPNPTFIPIPHPIPSPVEPSPVTSGRLILQWDDQITTNFQINSSTSRNFNHPNELDSLLNVKGLGVRFSISPCQNGSCPIVGPKDRTGWGGITVTTHAVNTGGEGPVWQQQFAMCKTAMTSPAYMRDAYKKRTPNWSLVINLDAAHFAAIQKKFNDVANVTAQDISFDFDTTEILSIECESYALMNNG